MQQPMMMIRRGEESEGKRWIIRWRHKCDCCAINCNRIVQMWPSCRSLVTDEFLQLPKKGSSRHYHTFGNDTSGGCPKIMDLILPLFNDHINHAYFLLWPGGNGDFVWSAVLRLAGFRLDRAIFFSVFPRDDSIVTDVTSAQIVV